MSIQQLSLQQQEFDSGGVSGYPTWSNATAAVTAAQAHAGANSLGLTSTAGGDMSAFSANISVVGGRSYTFSAWARTAVSARTVRFAINWYQADGTTASAIRAQDLSNATDASGSWTQTSAQTVTAPSDAFYAKPGFIVVATGAGAEVHYFDTASFVDNTGPVFKPGRTAELLLNSSDVSGFFGEAEWGAKVEAAPTDTFKATWHSFIPGEMSSTLSSSGYYDPTTSAVRSTIGVLASTTTGIVSYAPAGATAIGDFVRLIQINTTDYKEGSKIGGAIPLTWSVESTAPVGIGECLHVLGSENVGTITGTGSPLLTGASSSTGAIAHLHLTAYTAGTHQFKLQDSTALNGAYTDIAGGAFTNMTAAGAQRLVISGTIRAFVRCVAVIGTAAATYAVSAART